MRIPTVETRMFVVRSNLPDFVKGRKADMVPFWSLGILAVVIGLVSLLVLIQSRKKDVH